MSARLNWTSAIAPTPPPVPANGHWLMGLIAAIAILAGAALHYAGGETATVAYEEAEAVVVALGAGPARRLEAPPAGVEAAEADEATVVAERAEDAPPPAPPPEPRKIAGFSDGEGRLSSGTGGTGTGPPAVLPPPPPPASRPAPPPPKPAAPPPLDYNFIQKSHRIYMEQIIYPAASLRRREQGMGILRVVIDRSGRVLDWRLRKSTGYERLDQEIRRVAQITKQLDPLPDAYPADRAEADLKIIFFIEYVDSDEG